MKQPKTAAPRESDLLVLLVVMVGMIVAFVHSTNLVDLISSNKRTFAPDLERAFADRQFRGLLRVIVPTIIVLWALFCTVSVIR